MPFSLPLLYAEVCLLAAVAGVLAQRYPLPGLTLFGLVWLLDWPRTHSRGRSLCFGLAFVCAFGYAVLREPEPPPVPDWLERAASVAEDDKGEMRPPGALRVRARVESVTPMQDARVRTVLREARPAGEPLAAPYVGGIAWNWYRADAMPLPGEWVEATLRIGPQHGMRNPGGWDTDRYWADKDVWFRASSGRRTAFASEENVGEGKIERIRAGATRLREELRQKYVAALPRERAEEGGTRPARAAAMLPALVFGDRSWLDGAQVDLFARSTLAHSLALSGLHLGFALLAGAALAWGLGALRPQLFERISRPRLILLLSLPPAALYLWLGQAPVSLMRAACMLAFWVLLALLHRPRVLLDGVLAAVAALLLHNPVTLFDIGFQLSVLSVATIALCLPGLSRLAARLVPPNRHAGTGGQAARGAMLLFGTSLCIQLALLPLTVSTFGTSGLLFPLNLIWLPVLSMAVMPLAFLGLAATALGWTWLAEATLHLAALPCEGLTALLVRLDTAGLLVAPLMPRPHWLSCAGYWLLCLALPGLFSAIGKQRRDSIHATGWKRGLALTAAGCVMLTAMPLQALYADARPGVRLRLLDVGQGQSVLLEWSGLGPARVAGRALLDGGGFALDGFDPGKAVVAPVLTNNALPRLDAVFNSHPDVDHLGGLLFILEQFRVGRYYGNGDRPTPGLAARESATLAKSGLVRETLRAGDVIVLAPGLHLEALWPREEALSGLLNAPPAQEKGNNASLVLRLLWHGRPLALLCGDAERPALQELIAMFPERLRAEVLVLPHHGSASSLDPSFYRAVGPHLALAACGYANRFGFPSAAVRAELHTQGIPLYSTAAAGQLEVGWDAPDAPFTLVAATPKAGPERPPSRLSSGRSPRRAE